MKVLLKYICIIVCLSNPFGNWIKAADYFAFQGGAWNSTLNWKNVSCASGTTGTYPNSSTANATICNSGTAVSLGAFTMACNNLTINSGIGTFTFTGAGIVNVAGNLTMQSGAVISSATAAGTINVAGDFIIYGGTAGDPTFINSTGGKITINVTGNMYVYAGSGTIAEIQNNVLLAVNGTTNVDAPLTFTTDETNTYRKTFTGLVTIGAAGTWTSSAQTTTNSHQFLNGITNNNTTAGSFTSGTVHFMTNNQSLNGPGAFNFVTTAVVFVAIINVTNNSTVTMTNTANGALTGSGANTWTQGINSVLNYAGLAITLIDGFDASAAGNTVNYNATANSQWIMNYIRLPSITKYWHLTCSGGSFAKSLSADTYVYGNLTVTGTAIFGFVNRALYLYGDWISSSTNADPITQTLTVGKNLSFAGSTQQTVTNTGDLQGAEFGNVEIANTSSTGVVINVSGCSTSPCSMSILGGTATLTFTDGYLYSTVTNPLITNDGTIVTSGSAISFVDGPMRKIGDDAFVFPVGDDVAPIGSGAEDRWARIGISDPGTTLTDAYTAEYFKTSYSDLSVLSPLNNVSGLEYWTLDRVVTGAPAVSVTLYTEDCSFSGITDCPDLSVARYNGTDWEDEGQTAISSSGCNSPTTQPLNITSNAITTFSPFTFGSHGPNPLPVELLFFNTYRDDPPYQGGQGGVALRVRCDWATATESNNSHFAIERSQDTVNFWQIGIVQGAGNSSTVKYYTWYDNEPFYGLSYYRLRQVDYDGSFSYSNIESVYIGKLEIVNIYPNPASAYMNVVIYTEQNTQAVISAVNALGQKVYEQEISLQKGETKITVPVKQFAAGDYLFQAVLPSGERRQKIFLH